MDEAGYYHSLTTRNSGFIESEIQEKIRNTTLLIAGCGVGSSFATCAARMGVEAFILADGDTVSAHNLNRQFYMHQDIGRAKVHALADNLKAINPHVRVTAIAENLSPENIPGIVSQADFIFDTVDYIDLIAIATLHGHAHHQKKHLLTALNMGFGSGCLYFPPDAPLTLMDIIGADESVLGSATYADTFSGVIASISDQLDPALAKEMEKALQVMEDGKPCPASQIAPGAFSSGALAATVLYRILAGLPVQTAPHMMICNIVQDVQLRSINLSQSKG